MTKQVSKALVVDASVARAAGPPGAIHPTAKHCRDTLTAMLHICHRLVMTPDMKVEWNTYQSAFARSWRTSMVARRKLHFVRVDENKVIRAKVAGAPLSQKEKEAVLKDCLLVEAALATDATILSLDETVRTLFSRVAPGIAELNPIVWVNPAIEADGCQDWLAAGAKPERHRRLRTRP